MGVENKKKLAILPLPAPTETTESLSSPTDVTDTDDKSTFSLPEDGTPVTIKARGHKSKKSQTSLLIEYFEGSKASSSSARESQRRPSVRVRVTPGGKSKHKSGGDHDHILITETKSSRRTSYGRRSTTPAIPATPRHLQGLDDGHSVVSPGDHDDDRNCMSPDASTTGESSVSRHPIDIEIEGGSRQRRRRPSSPLFPASGTCRVSHGPNMSEISDIPRNSFLDGSAPTNISFNPSERHRSRGPSRNRSCSPGHTDDLLDEVTAELATAVIMDRTKQRSEGREITVIKPRDKDRKHKSSKSRTTSSTLEESSRRAGEPVKSQRTRRSSRGQHHAQGSTVSDEAGSSLLSSPVALQNQPVRATDQHSVRSGASKASSINNPKLLETVEDAIRRLILPELNALKREQSRRGPNRGSVTSSATSASKGAAGEAPTKDGKPRDKRNREARHEMDDNSSVGAPSYESGHNEKLVPPAFSSAVSAGSVATESDIGSPVVEKRHRERRRRRAEYRNHSSDQVTDNVDDDDDDDDFRDPPEPPMPLMSETNASDMTRSSIQSANSNARHSALLSKSHHEVVREEMESATPTPTQTPITLQASLGTQHANISHGDLKALPRTRMNDRAAQDTLGVRPDDMLMHPDEPQHYGEMGYFDDHNGAYHGGEYGSFYPDSQDVPPPLKYVPYQTERRGLSPILSVSGYTETGSEAPNRTDSRVNYTGGGGGGSAVSSPDKSSMGGGAHSLVSYTEDGETDGHATAAGRPVRALGANPDFIRSSGIESNVASLVDGSMLEETGLSAPRAYADGMRDSMDESRSGGGAETPSKRSMESRQDQTATPRSATSRFSDRYAEEYDLDEYGRKVPRYQYAHSPTASEAAITGAAVEAAATATLKDMQGGAQHQKAQGHQQSPERTGESEWMGEGVQRNSSFRERTMRGHRPASTPTHSVDRLDDMDAPRLGHSAVPDPNDDPHEFEYAPSEQQDEDEDGPSTPRQRPVSYQHLSPVDDGGTPRQKSSGRGGLHSSPSQAMSGGEQVEDWQRDAADNKRDTLITNPYEDAHPIVNLPDLDQMMQTYGNGLGTRSPIGHKVDEGYISQGPNKTPDMHGKGKGIDYGGLSPVVPEDSRPKHQGHLSGLSHGMQSPLYDASTGTGIDRIESKDIIALMQHLMVRDAQRSARDTEILVTLVRSATEMRNSFEDIKRMLADTEDVIITEVKDNTEKTVQRAIGGPRPFPGSLARSLNTGGSQATADDLPAKKHNLFRRALKGLSAKGANDLGRIEEMLMQLLTEVDVLKAQTARESGSGASNHDGQSYTNLRPEVTYEQDQGYEPEGHAGTSTTSHPSQSGQLSGSHSRGASAAKLGHEQQQKYADHHRISTVPEDDEDDWDDEVGGGDGGGQSHDEPPYSSSHDDEFFLGSARERRNSSAVPLGTPRLAASADNTPRQDKGKKHRSSGSGGFVNKVMSRWTESTKAFRSKKVVDDDMSHHSAPASRSGSALGHYEHGTYGSVRGDRNDEDDGGVVGTEREPLGRSASELDLTHGKDVRAEDMTGTDAAAMQTPPRLVTMSPEDPKYRAHRNSLNLQHPQPRSGQAERFKMNLEHQAEGFSSPGSTRSGDWPGSATSLGRYGNAPDTQYWMSSPMAHGAGGSAAGPPRPPKELLDRSGTPGRQTPGTTPRRERVSRFGRSPQPYNASPGEPGYHQSTGSPRLENRNLNNALGLPGRRPSGPRAMTPKSILSEDGMEGNERRRKRDTVSSMASQDDM